MKVFKPTPTSKVFDASYLVRLLAPPVLLVANPVNVIYS
jgi:hypothetical protein